jgi:FKBP-type peptidyl-prolyl cis-trans isomerase 2
MNEEEVDSKEETEAFVDENAIEEIEKDDSEKTGIEIDESLNDVLQEIIEEPVEDDEHEEPFYEGAVNNGDFINIQLTGRVEETGEIFDTTEEELAREEGIYQEGRVYGPRLVIVGESWVLKGLDERLPGLEEEEEKEIEIPPEEAFGVRDPNNIQMIPFRILRSKGVNPIVGQELEIDGRTAMIRSIGAGRVQVDYNHSLAGRKIIYSVKVLNILEGELDKIKALIGRRFQGIEPDKFGVKALKNKYRIEIPDQIFFNESIQIAKRGLALDLLRFFQDLKAIEFIEVVQRN